MGLLNRRHSGSSAWLERHAYWTIPVLMVVTSALVAVLGDEGRELLRYDRQMIQGGEAWRLVSGHFAHLGVSHLLLNVAGLVLSWFLVGQMYSSNQWALVLAISLSTVSAGFWFVDTGLQWYVGMSGILHGLLLAGAVAGIRRNSMESLAIVVLIVCKLAYEQLLGPLPGSESTSGGAVAVNAHLFGAIGGAIAGGVFWRRVESATPI